MPPLPPLPAGSSPLPRLQLVADSAGDPDLFFFEALPGSQCRPGSFYLDPGRKQRQGITAWLQAAAEAFHEGSSIRPLAINGLIKARSCMHGWVYLKATMASLACHALRCCCCCREGMHTW